MLLGLDSYSYHLAFGRHPDFRPNVPMNLFAFIDRVVELGLHGFQIDPMHLESSEETYLRAVRNKAEANGLFIEHGTIGVDRGAIEKGVQVCEVLGSPIIRTFVGFDRFSRTIDVSQEVERAKRQIRDVLGLLRASGITLAIENHGDVTSSELVEIVEEIGSPHVRICLDVGNSLCTLEDPLEAARRMASYAVTTHFKDYTVVCTNFGCKIVGVTLGMGVLPLEEMLQVIKAEATLNRLILETPIEAAADEHETLEKEYRAVRESVAYCRAVLGVGTP